MSIRRRSCSMTDTECVVPRPSRKRPAEMVVDEMVETPEVAEVLPVSEEVKRPAPVPGCKPQVSERRRYMRLIPKEQPRVVESLCSKLRTLPLPPANPKPWQLKVSILERHQLTGLFLQLVHTTDNIHDITDPRMADVVSKVKLMEHRIFEEADDKAEYCRNLKAKIADLRKKILTRQWQRKQQYKQMYGADA